MTSVLFLFVACRAETPETRFNQMIAVPDANQARFQTNEDEPIAIEYSVDRDVDSIDLSVFVASKPKYGKLEDCTSIGNQLSCTYLPNKNFYGQDYFKVRTKDGSFLGKEALINIEILPIADGPSGNKNKELDLLMDTTLSFEVKAGTDIDSAANELDYKIVEGPQSGQLIDCFPETGNRNCRYRPNPGFLGSDFFYYKILDETKLESESVKVVFNVSDGLFDAEETFTQNEQSTLDGFDLVWVIDNSRSMDDEQEQLADNTASFIQNFVDSKISLYDFKMGVTTTEAYYSDAETFRTDVNGNAYDFSRSSLAANKDLFIENFKDAVKVGIGARFEGSNQIEKTFSSMDRVLTQEAGWFRGNKKALIYIFLTDEKEQSYEKTVAQWHAQFDATKDEIEKVKMFPIIDASKDSGQIFAKTATHYNTPVYDINSPFDSILDNITLNISNLLESFNLNPGRNIIAGSLKVFVNGVEVPRLNGNNEEQWSLAGNSLSFSQKPSASSEIKVFYKYSI